ncbi:hypothetical protein B0H13DRAFT_1922818 [Mycena leptocephala]|nr:hypothetical protein B0H13DRAFT_1922818 [Mycena leptocephala]
MVVSFQGEFLSGPFFRGKPDKFCHLGELLGVGDTEPSILGDQATADRGLAPAVKTQLQIQFLYIDFTKLVPTKVKSKTSTKVKAVVAKGLKALAGVKSRAAKAGKAAASEDEEAVSSEENSNSTDPKSDQSDGEDAHDVSPNEDEFQTEVPHIISGNSKVADDEEGDNSDVDVEMKGKHGSARELFDSDNESIEIDKPRVKSKGQAGRHDSAHEVIDKPRVKSKGRARRQEKSEPDTDDTFPDVPPSRRVNAVSKNKTRDDAIQPDARLSNSGNLSCFISRCIGRSRFLIALLHLEVMNLDGQGPSTDVPAKSTVPVGTFLKLTWNLPY